MRALHNRSEAIFASHKSYIYIISGPQATYSANVNVTPEGPQAKAVGSFFSHFPAIAIKARKKREAITLWPSIALCRRITYSANVMLLLKAHSICYAKKGPFMKPKHTY
jgi:hypothetical protein